MWFHVISCDFMWFGVVILQRDLQIRTQDQIALPYIYNTLCLTQLKPFMWFYVIYVIWSGYSATGPADLNSGRNSASGDTKHNLFTAILTPYVILCDLCDLCAHRSPEAFCPMVTVRAIVLTKKACCLCTGVENQDNLPGAAGAKNGKKKFFSKIR